MGFTAWRPHSAWFSSQTSRRGATGARRDVARVLTGKFNSPLLVLADFRLSPVTLLLLLLLLSLLVRNKVAPLVESMAAGAFCEQRRNINKIALNCRLRDSAAYDGQLCKWPKRQPGERTGGRTDGQRERS